jgi:hypothetical protein
MGEMVSDSCLTPFPMLACVPIRCSQEALARFHKTLTLGNGKRGSFNLLRLLHGWRLELGQWHHWPTTGVGN